ncbi:MAG: hypothetical protein ABW123_11610 [Cystobacter sp.]
MPDFSTGDFWTTDTNATGGLTVIPTAFNLYTFAMPVPSGTPAAAVPEATPFTPPLVVSAEVDFGADISTFPDLDASLALSMSTSSVRKMVGEALCRRFCTARGALWAHPDYGEDLRAFLNEVITDEALHRCASAAELEAEQDERILSASAVVTYDAANEKLSLALEVETDVGPFEYLLAVDELTVTLIDAAEETA